jgi:hypothetical protein
VSGHTPGPWRVGFGSPEVTAGCVRRNPGWTPIVRLIGSNFGFGEVVALVDRPTDAEFVTRAVNSHDELLAALKAIADYTDECEVGVLIGTDDDHSAVCKECQLILAARAAIAKASGR